MLIVRRILLVIFIITCGTTTVALAQGGQHGPPGPIGNFQVPNGTDAHGNQVLKGDNLFTNVFEEFHSAASDRVRFRFFHLPSHIENEHNL